MISIEEIKENYEKFSDSKIENIALSESKELRKEVLSILKDEILKRKLDPDLITWFEAETNTLTDFEKQSIKTKIENLKCPNCGLNHNRLLGQEFNSIVSFIIILNNSTRDRILCYNCGRNKKLISFLKTGLTGWWSARGFFLTPYTLLKEMVNVFYQKKISDRILDSFIERHNGILRLKGTEKDELMNLVMWHNNDYYVSEEEEKEENQKEK
tara:strand:+ start:922 stop:1560 length:639 start_codon:yes stop_codon:yes gene_type:complete